MTAKPYLMVLTKLQGGRENAEEHMVSSEFQYSAKDPLLKAHKMIRKILAFNDSVLHLARLSPKVPRRNWLGCIIISFPDYSPSFFSLEREKNPYYGSKMDPVFWALPTPLVLGVPLSPSLSPPVPQIFFRLLPPRGFAHTVPPL